MHLQVHDCGKVIESQSGPHSSSSQQVTRALLDQNEEHQLSLKEEASGSKENTGVSWSQLHWHKDSPAYFLSSSRRA